MCNLPEDTSACGLEKPVNKPLTLWLVDAPQNHNVPPVNAVQLKISNTKPTLVSVPCSALSQLLLAFNYRYVEQDSEYVDTRESCLHPIWTGSYSMSVGFDCEDRNIGFKASTQFFCLHSFTQSFIYFFALCVTPWCAIDHSVTFFWSVIKIIALVHN